MLKCSRRWTLPSVLALAVVGCGDSPGSPGQPDAGGGGNQLSVAGSYDTRAALLPGGTCSGVTVQDEVTTVQHAPGSSTLTLTHAGVSYAGTVDASARFQTTPRTVVVSPASFRITLSGQFGLTGLEATVSVEQTSPTVCGYSVRWVGTKSGSPNVIPG